MLKSKLAATAVLAGAVALSTTAGATALPNAPVCRMPIITSRGLEVLPIKCMSDHATAPVAFPGSPPMPSRGTTVATIHSQFPVVVLYNFTYSPTINTTIANAANIYLARLSREYYIHSGGNLAPLLEVAAKRLTATNLLKLQAAFGKANVDAAVNAYAPAAVKASYTAGGARTVLARSQALYIQRGIAGLTPAPNLDMTIYDIFLDSWTAGLSVEASLASTAAYAGSYLSASFAIGYQIGGAIYYIDDKIDPNINAWIGDEEGALIDEVIDFVSSPDFYPAYDSGGYEYYYFDDYSWCGVDCDLP